MQSSDIDTAPPPAVKNLRSKFEQLALKPGPNGPGLAPGYTPRPRATSGSQANGNRPLDSPSLRPSNSSSDLRRKPPPPPPSRNAKPSATSNGTPIPIISL